MTDLKAAIINKIYSDSQYYSICKKVGNSYADDLLQEIAEFILTTDIERLPPIDRLRFWFYRVAANMMSKTGTIGKKYNKHKESYIENMQYDTDCYENANTLIPSEHRTSYKKHHAIDVIHNDRINEHQQEKLLKITTQLMLSLSEFENRILLLYNQTGSQAEVSNITGIHRQTIWYTLQKIKQKAASMK